MVDGVGCGDVAPEVSRLLRAGFVPAGIGLAFSFRGSKSSNSKLELVVSRLIRSSELLAPLDCPWGERSVREAGCADDEGALAVALASATSTLDWKDTVNWCKQQVVTRRLRVEMLGGGYFY